MTPSICQTDNQRLAVCIKKIYGVWHCGWWPHIPKQYLGLGFTEKEAFDDWEANR